LDTLSIAFVCTGNRSRSVLAEAFMQRLTSRTIRFLCVFALETSPHSRPPGGLAAVPSGPRDEHAVTARAGRLARCVRVSNALALQQLTTCEPELEETRVALTAVASVLRRELAPR
jgi:hypothetical protein